jgi:hypothetical protein
MAICVPSIRQQQKGCNAHIVRLAEYQAVKKIDPRGVEIRKLLILRQTNNVCVAPPAPQRPCTPCAPAPPPIGKKQKISEAFPEIKAKPTKNRINWTKYEFLLHSNIKIVTFGVT